MLENGNCIICGIETSRCGRYIIRDGVVSLSLSAPWSFVCDEHGPVYTLIEPLGNATIEDMEQAADGKVFVLQSDRRKAK